MGIRELAKQAYGEDMQSGVGENPWAVDMSGANTAQPQAPAQPPPQPLGQPGEAHFHQVTRKKVPPSMKNPNAEIHETTLVRKTAEFAYSTHFDVDAGTVPMPVRAPTWSEYRNHDAKTASEFEANLALVVPFIKESRRFGPEGQEINETTLSGGGHSVIVPKRMDRMLAYPGISGLYGLAGAGVGGMAGGPGGALLGGGIGGLGGLGIAGLADLLTARARSRGVDELEETQNTGRLKGGKPAHLPGTSPMSVSTDVPATYDPLNHLLSSGLGGLGGAGWGAAAGGGKGALLGALLGGGAGLGLSGLSHLLTNRERGRTDLESEDLEGYRAGKRQDHMDQGSKMTRTKAAAEMPLWWQLYALPDEIEKDAGMLSSLAVPAMQAISHWGGSGGEGIMRRGLQTLAGGIASGTRMASGGLRSAGQRAGQALQDWGHGRQGIIGSGARMLGKGIGLAGDAAGGAAQIAGHGLNREVGQMIHSTVPQITGVQDPGMLARARASFDRGVGAASGAIGDRTGIEFFKRHAAPHAGIQREGKTQIQRGASPLTQSLNPAPPPPEPGMFSGFFGGG